MTLCYFPFYSVFCFYFIVLRNWLRFPLFNVWNLSDYNVLLWISNTLIIIIITTIIYHILWKVNIPDSIRRQHNIVSCRRGTTGIRESYYDIFIGIFLCLSSLSWRKLYMNFTPSRLNNTDGTIALMQNKQITLVLNHNSRPLSSYLWSDWYAYLLLPWSLRSPRDVSANIPDAWVFGILRLIPL